MARSSAHLGRAKGQGSSHSIHDNVFCLSYKKEMVKMAPGTSRVLGEHCYEATSWPSYGLSMRQYLGSTRSSSLGASGSPWPSLQDVEQTAWKTGAQPHRHQVKVKQIRKGSRTPTSEVGTGEAGTEGFFPGCKEDVLHLLCEQRPHLPL